MAAEAVLRAARGRRPSSVQPALESTRSRATRLARETAARLRKGRALPPYRSNGKIFRVDRTKWWCQKSAWFTVADIPLQTVITGAPGSGKTSCVVHTIVREGTRCGVPFLVYCAKQEDADDFGHYIKAGGGFAITVAPRGPNGGRPRYVFPFLRYLAEMDVSTLDIVEVLVAAMNALEGGKQAKPSGDQTFWNKSMRVVLARVITLLRASDFDFSLKTLMRAMGGLPIKGTKAPFFSLLKTSALQRDSEQVQAAIRYFDEEFRTLEPRTSGSIRAVWSSMAAELEQQPLDQLLDDPGPGQLAVTPSTVLDDRIPVILDLPTLVSPRTGGVFQAVFHQCLKIALHKRKPGGHVVGLVQDEFQASAPTARELTDIMATARSKGVGGIYATQALSNVMAVYGREDARAVFGAPNMLIACRNDDADTKEFVSARSGERYVEVESTTENADGESTSLTRREEKRPAVEGYVLSELRRPKREQWRPHAEAYVLRSGEAHLVQFDRLPPGLNQRLRRLIMWVYDRLTVDVSALPRRIAKVGVAVGSLGILALVFMPILVHVDPRIRRAVERWYLDAPTGQTGVRSARGTDDIVHVVRRGETLGRIAARYGVTDLDSIAVLNGLPSVDSIEVGQRLRIPAAVTGDEVPRPYRH